MVKVFVSNIIKKDESGRVGLPDTAKLVYGRLSDSLKDRVDKAANEGLRLARISAYGLLAYALKSTFGIEWVIIKNGTHGKPELCDSSVKINISHSGGACAVAISEREEIGVDIEEKIDEEREKRLKQRFFSDISSIDVMPIDAVEYSLLEYARNGELFEASKGFEVVESYSEKINFTKLWTLSEAIMKCDGRGFAAISEITNIKDLIEADTVEISKDDKRYALSVTIKKP